MALTIGKEIEIDIVDVAYGGRGVGRYDGCAVFVPFALTGERVRVRITKARKKYAEGEMQEILRVSEFRIEPKCPLAYQCQGCSYQHVEYEEEVRLKQQQFEGLLKRIGGLKDVKCKPPVASPKSVEYRNKIVMHAQRERKLGYFGADDRTVLDIPSCMLAVKPINDRLKHIRLDPKKLKMLPPNGRVTFRWTENDGVVHWIDRNSGVERLIEKSAVGDMKVPRRSFYQVNPYAGELLLKIVTDIIDDIKPEYFIDLFCGVGLFAIAAGLHGAKQILGVERQSMAVRAARQNTKAAGVWAEFIAADAEDIAADALDKIDCSKAMVIVDPPREGLEKDLISVLLEKKPKDIIYVSCAADTLARDLKLLTENSYELVECQLIDMFPRTQHFESVSLLKCRKPGFDRVKSI